MIRCLLKGLEDNTMRASLAMILLALAVPVLAGPALAAEPASDRKCLENRDIRQKQLSAADGYFVRTSRGWWRNSAACSAYGKGRALRTNAYNDRQCRNDLVEVFDAYSRIGYGACTLGDWQKVAGPPEVAAK